MNMNGTWAAKCYGWMELSDTQFDVISAVAGPLNLSRWVIVKEYEAVSTDASHIPKIHANFSVAKRAKILPQDIRVDNYRGTKIVDLSSALTYPCPGWSDFLFKFFYTETVHGVLDWFPDPPSPKIVPSLLLLLLTGAFVLVLCGFLVLRKIRE